jgi:hypothetical protein
MKSSAWRPASRLVAGASFAAGIVAVIALAVVLHESSRRNCATQASYFTQSLLAHGRQLPDTAPEIGACALAQNLRIEYAAAVAERNPLFALPGTDLEALRFAIAELGMRQQEMAVLQRKPAHTRFVSSALYPLGFLREAADLEEKRRSFVHTPDPNKHRAYQRALEQTVSVFLAELAAYRSAFEATVPQTSAVYVAGGTAITRADIPRIIDRLEERGRAARERLRERASCINGSISDCQPEDLATPIPEPPPTSLPPLDLQRAEETLRLISHARGRPSSLINPAPQETPEPTVALIASICTEYFDAQPIFTLRANEPEIEGQPSFSYPVFLGDAPFIDTLVHGETPFFRHFAQQGARYVFIQPMVDYMCPELGTDLGNIYTTLRIKQEVEKNPFSFYAENPGRKERLLHLEQALLGETVTREHHARAYLAELAEMLQEGLSQTQRQRITNLLLMASARGAGFEHTVHRAALTQRYVNLTASTGAEYVQAPYLFFVRNGLLPLFMAWNNTVVGDDFTSFEKIRFELHERPFVLYSSLPEEDRAEAVKDLRVYILDHVPAKL